MTTELYRDEGIVLNRFWGGPTRGLCFQITESGVQRVSSDGGVVQVTFEQAIQLHTALGVALEKPAVDTIAAIADIVKALKGEDEE